nr:hypothetical protein RKHAN_00617 [Rhizobium sp. Khangiran2]
MKSIVSRIPRKLLLILAGVTVLGGGSGAAAVYIGADRLLGPSYGDLNGLTCTTIETIRIKKADRYWIRKYVTTDEPGDGIARLKTALRVARKVQQTEHPDLVQVTVLDPAGPADRSRMRGRAIGAQVVYVPDTSRLPAGSRDQAISAYYVDGSASATGEFWGLRIDLPLEDAQAMSASLTDDADCVDPVIEGGDGHGTAADHGKTKEQEEAAGHSETPDAGHGGADEAHGPETSAVEHGKDDGQGLVASLMGVVGLGGEELPVGTLGDERAGEAAPASKGWLDSIKGMVGLGKDAEHSEQVAPAHEAEHPVKDGKDEIATPAGPDEHDAERATAPAPSHDGADEEAPAKAAGDDHGAAWLAKLRVQPITSEAANHQEPEGQEAAAAPAAEASHAPVVAEDDDPEKHRRKPKPQETH